MDKFVRQHIRLDFETVCVQKAALAKAIVARFVVLLRNFGNGITERYQKMVTAVVMRSAKQLIGLQQQTLV